MIPFATAHSLNLTLPMLRLILSLSLLISATALADSRQTTVLHSLKPLQLITEGIASGLVLSQNMSLEQQHGHDYSLRFSDLRRLQQSDLLVWVGPQFEHYLEKPLAAMQPKVAQFAYLQRASQIYRDKHIGEDQTHVWLDPVYVIELLPVLAAALGAAAPQHRETIAQRAGAYLKSLKALDARVRKQLLPFRGRGVISDHGGLDLFLHRYGLRHTGSLQSEAHSSISLLRAKRIRRELELGNATCVTISTPEQREGLEQVFSGLDVAMLQLDLMGSAVSSYQQLIEQLASGLAQCMRDS